MEKYLSETEKIEYLSGMVPSQCSCSECANMCKRVPCLGTPTDILNLIKAGYGDKIKLTTWASGMSQGVNPIDMYQAEYDAEKGACVFLENDLCTLHEKGLKPTEGKLATHDQSKFQRGKYPPWLVVALTWLVENNDSIIKEIDVLMGNPDREEQDLRKALMSALENPDDIIILKQK